MLCSAYTEGVISHSAASSEFLQLGGTFMGRCNLLVPVCLKGVSSMFLQFEDRNLDRIGKPDLLSRS